MVSPSYTVAMGLTIEKTCEGCNRTFRAPMKEHKRGNGRFCSRSCFWKHFNKGTRGKGKGRVRLSYAERKAKYAEATCVGGLVARVRQRCRNKGVQCDLNCDVFREMLRAQEGRCFYTGRAMTLGLGTRGDPHPDQMSVDRKDPDAGYTLGNMVLCCLWVNCAKARMAIEDLKTRAAELLEAP